MMKNKSNTSIFKYLNILGTYLIFVSSITFSEKNCKKQFLPGYYYIALLLDVMVFIMNQKKHQFDVCTKIFILFKTGIASYIWISDIIERQLRGLERTSYCSLSPFADVRINRISLLYVFCCIILIFRNFLMKRVQTEIEYGKTLTGNMRA